MAGNLFGTLFRITTWGESHGPGMGVVIDGCPPGIALDEADIQRELDRRRPGQSSVSTPRSEDDRVAILSGVFEGRTTGAPIALTVANSAMRSTDYDLLRDVYRPGHADYTYQAKYGVRDYRGGGRSSGRETIGRVAAGAVARKVLASEGIEVYGYTLQIGDVRSAAFDRVEIERNAVRCPDAAAASAMVDLITGAVEAGDSLGGIAEVVITGCPPGLGDPVFDKLDADLAKALMSIGAVKGVEIGDGFAVAGRRGSENNDELTPEGFATNRAGGILGGISTGRDIVARIAVKPTASISREQRTVDTSGAPRTISIGGRHDPCIVPRIVPVAESMAALVIVDKLLVNRSLR